MEISLLSPPVYMLKTRRKFAIEGNHTLVAASLLSFWNLLTLCSISFNSSWISWPCFCKSLCSPTFSLMACNITYNITVQQLSHGFLILWSDSRLKEVATRIDRLHVPWKTSSVSQNSLTLQGNNTLNFRLTRAQVEICCTSQHQANKFFAVFFFSFF